MGKRKRCTGENEAPFLMDALPCPSAEDDPVLKKTVVGSAPSVKHSSRYGLVYSRRKPNNKSTISTSSNSVVKQDEKLPSLKLDGQNNSPSGLNTENSEKQLSGSERKTSFLPPKVVYSNPAKMLCGLCGNQLKRKPLVLENSVTLDDVSVVAVLVCGHVYHADCLEPKTSVEDQSDPLCPLCVKRKYP